MNKHVFAGRGGTIYTVSASGDLIWSRHLGFRDGAATWMPPIKKVIGEGWGGFTTLTASSQGVIYGVASNGDLYWSKHLGHDDGAPTWLISYAVKVGQGWGAFKRVFAADDGILYAVQNDGTLLWYKHHAWLTGADDWAPPRQVGNADWQTFDAVMASSGGVLYARLPNGSLRWYKHLGASNGTVSWDGGHEVGTGWQMHRKVIASDEGVLYGFDASESASWYRHHGIADGSNSWGNAFGVGPSLSANPLPDTPAAPSDTGVDPSPDVTTPPANPAMRYLVRPLVPYAASTPGLGGANARYFAIASEQTGMVLTVRDEIALQPFTSTPLTEVAVGVDGTAWGSGSDGTIWRWNGAQGWDLIPGNPGRVSVGSATEVWAALFDGGVARWNGSAWESIPRPEFGAAHVSQVAAASDGAVWALTSNHNVYYRRGTTWEKVDGTLTQIAVGGREMVWGVNAADQVFVRKGSAWVLVAGSLRHVSVAADGAVFGVRWAMTSTTSPPEYQTLRWNGADWETVASGASGVAKVTAASASNLWATNTQGQVYRSAVGGLGRVVQQHWTGDARQKWRFRPNGDGTFRIENAATVKVLTVQGGSASAAALITCEAWTGAAHQRWRLRAFDDGRFHIESAHSGLVLNLGSLQAGAALDQATGTASGTQRWRVSEVVASPADAPANAVVKLYSDTNYVGRETLLGVGSYNTDVLNTLPNPNFASAKVPAGLKVALLGDRGFRGHLRTLSADTPVIPDYATERVNGVVVEPVVTLYARTNFSGVTAALGMGRTNLDVSGIGDNALSSLRVPPGMMVTLYSERDFQGAQRVYFEDTGDLGADWSDRASSVEIRMLGVLIPRNSLRFGGTVTLRGADGRLLNSTFSAVPISGFSDFTLVRAGPTQHLSHVAYGDVVALRAATGGFVRDTGAGLTTSVTLGQGELWVVWRSGGGTSDVFVSKGDTISLKSVATQRFITSGGDGSASLSASLTAAAQWSVHGYAPPNDHGVATGPALSTDCGANVCATESCGENYCGAEACNVDAAFVSVCAVAATGFAVCGVDAATASACGAAASGVALCGADACVAAACGAATCGAAACVTDACGTAACLGDACGAALCGADVSPFGACLANAAGIDVCPADLCAANVCGINACPADACAADACGIDLIPLIPFI